MFAYKKIVKNFSHLGVWGAKTSMTIHRHVGIWVHKSKQWKTFDYVQNDSMKSHFLQFLCTNIAFCVKMYYLVEIVHNFPQILLLAQQHRFSLQPCYSFVIFFTTEIHPSFFFFFKFLNFFFFFWGGGVRLHV